MVTNGTRLSAGARMGNLRRSEFAGAVVGDVAVVLVQGWVFMLAVGSVHHGWFEQLPTIQYSTAVLLVLSLRVVAFVLRPRSAKRGRAG